MVSVVVNVAVLVLHRVAHDVKVSLILRVVVEVTVRGLQVPGGGGRGGPGGPGGGGVGKVSYPEESYTDDVGTVSYNSES